MQRLLVIFLAIVLGGLSSMGALFAIVERGRSPYTEAHLADVAGDTSKAIVLFEAAVKLDGEQELKVSAKRRLAALYIMQGGLDRAATHLEGVLQYPQATVDDLQKLIQVQVRRGKKESSISLSERLLTHPDATKEVKEEAGWRMVELGNIEGARRALERLFDGTDDEIARALHMRLLTYVGRYDDAQTQLEAAQTSFPNTPRILTAEGELLLAVGDLEKAQSVLEKALELHPTFLPALLSLGEVTRLLGEATAADLLVRRAVSFYPESVAAQMALVQVMLESGGDNTDNILADAGILCADMKARLPGHGAPFECEGRVAEVEGEWTKAEHLYQKARDLSPGLVAAGLLQAKVLRGLGDPQQGYRIYERLGVLFSAHLGVRVGRALCLAELGEERRARSELEAILRDVPDYGVAKVALADLWRKGGREFHAESLYKDAIEKQPWLRRADYGLAGLYFERGHFLKAKQVYESIIEQAPTEALAHLKLAGVLATLGRSKAAIEEVKLALKLGMNPEVVSGETTLEAIASLPKFRKLLVDEP